MTVTGALSVTFAVLMFLLTVLLVIGGQPVVAPLCLFLLFLTIGLISIIRQIRSLERSTIGSRTALPPAQALVAAPSLSLPASLLEPEASS